MELKWKGSGKRPTVFAAPGHGFRSAAGTLVREGHDLDGAAKLHQEKAALAAELDRFAGVSEEREPAAENPERFKRGSAGE